MPWNVLTGVIEMWSDEGLRDVGRRRFHEARGTRLSSEGDLALPGDVYQTRLVFAARRLPWRLTMISLDEAEPDDRHPVVTSWADDATAVLRGSPAEPYMVGPHESYGDGPLGPMLEPAPLATLVATPWPTRFEVPGWLLERDMSVLPAFVSLASDRYEVIFDAELDILTSWSAVIDGAVIQRVSLTHVTPIE